MSAVGLDEGMAIELPVELERRYEQLCPHPINGHLNPHQILLSKYPEPWLLLGFGKPLESLAVGPEKG